MKNPRNTHYFCPPFWMRHGMMQTFIAGSKLRKVADSDVFACAKTHIISTPNARLKASYSVHPESQGIVVLIHGWEGSETSTYVKSLSAYLFGRGYSIIRLNLRDHGDTHHLNKDVFHANRLNEVVDCVVQILDSEPSQPVYLVGFSLGGNFVLRLARVLSGTKTMTPDHIFAISPVIKPFEASPLVDENVFIRRYFRKKWRTSLEKKVAAFPDSYNFDDLFGYKMVMDISDRFLPEYTPFATSEDYFNGYRIWPNDLADCDIPTTIIMAEDDPVIPASHLEELNLSSCVERIILKYGGHNGFFQSLSGPTWYETHIGEALSKYSVSV